MRDYSEEKLELFQDKDITIPFTRESSREVVKVQATHYLIYSVAFIALLILEGYLLSLIPGVTPFLNDSKAVGLIAGAFFLLINYGILYRYMKYAEEKISTARYQQEKAENERYRQVLSDNGFTVSRYYSFKDVSNALYTDEDNVTYRAAAGHYDGKSLNMILVAE